MVSVELVLVALLVMLVVGVIAMLGVTAFAAWMAARLATNLVTLLRPAVIGPTDIRDVELRVAGLRALDHVDSGVVTAVVPERRRGARGLSRFSLSDGVRFDLALPTPDDRRAQLWVPVPEELTGNSRLERVAEVCDVFPDEISDAVGAELPLDRGDDGQWRVDESSRTDSVGSLSRTRGAGAYESEFV
jgi:hypothetical protein